MRALYAGLFAALRAALINAAERVAARARAARSSSQRVAPQARPAKLGTTYDKLESLRGVAACCVALHHSPFTWNAKPAPFISSSHLFVDFFFILSGFVMTHAYREQIVQGLSFQKYALLRLARLYPLHVFAHLLYALNVFGKWWLHSRGVFTATPESSMHWPSFWSNLLLLQGLGLHPSLYWNRPSWSIGTEIIAYGVFFVATVSLDRRGRALPALLFASMLYGVLLASDDRRLDITYDFGLVRCLAGFYLGSALFRVSKKWGTPEPRRHRSTLLEAACVVAVVVSVSSVSHSELFVISAVLAFAASVSVMSRSQDGLIGAVLKAPWLRKIGVWSYSIYLLHLVCFEIAGNVAQHVFGMDLTAGLGPAAILSNAAVLGGVIALSRYTYEWIEEPARRWAKARLARPRAAAERAPEGRAA